ncbi:MAG TPA: hypothetical protein VMR33_04065 [Candidatus Baltobacteraceae bacterium]|nr:hypothetical protein [Candidatus Baltobacteraceae bacterium]
MATDAPLSKCKAGQVSGRAWAVALAAFMGANILAEATQQPIWRDNLRASSEK